MTRSVKGIFSLQSDLSGCVHDMSGLCPPPHPPPKQLIILWCCRLPQPCAGQPGAAASS
jgi:hypothetical protein